MRLWVIRVRLAVAGRWLPATALPIIRRRVGCRRSNLMAHRGDPRGRRHRDEAAIQPTDDGSATG